MKTYSSLCIDAIEIFTEDDKELVGSLHMVAFDSKTKKGILILKSPGIFVSTFQNFIIKLKGDSKSLTISGVYLQSYATCEKRIKFKFEQTTDWS